MTRMTTYDAHSGEVYLLRHMEAEFNKRTGFFMGRTNDSMPTETGEYQTERLGVWLAEHEIIPKAVRSSPAIRAIRTAEMILDVMGLTCHCPIVIDDRLQELDRGDWEGRPHEAVLSPYIEGQMAAEGIDFVTPGGESIRQAGERMHDAAIDMLQQGGTVFGVTHGLSTRSLVGKYERWPVERILTTPMPNTAMTKLISYGGRPGVATLPDGDPWIGYAPHLRD